MSYELYTKVMPLVSCLVLTNTGKRALQAVECVRTLQKQTIADQIEIIVIENHSQDDSIGILRNSLGDEENVQLGEAPKPLGYGKGNNYGFRYATGDFILVINPDNRLEENGLARLVQELRDNPDIGIISPKLVFPDGTVRDSFRRFPRFSDSFIRRTFLRRFFGKRIEEYSSYERDPKGPLDVDWVAGACFLLHRDLYAELEGFDRRFYLFFEDIDLCRRTWERKLRVVLDPRIIAYDSKVRLSAGGIGAFFTKKTVRIHVASAIKYFWKWKGVSLPR